MYIYYYTDGDIPEIKMSGKSIISKSGRKVTLEVQETEDSYRYRSLMAKPQLVLKFSLPKYVEIPVGAWCVYMGQTFTLNSAQNIKKNGTRNIEYSLTMGTEQDNMALYKMRNSVDKRLKYSMTAKPHEFIEEIVANLNDRDGAGKWNVGTVIDASEKTIEFNHTYIDAALSQVAETFETEWEIVDTAIHLHKVEYYKDDPLPLSYGKGNGFMPGVGRTTPSNEQPIKRLYVQGGDRNIDYSKYGSKELLLPKSQTLEYEGRTYKSDADGYYIERSDKSTDAVKEDSLDCSSHYPSRIGKVTAVEVANAAKNFYDIIDNTIPASLNYNDYLIDGESMTIIFQSGMLAGDGKEFELKYKHSERRFEIVPQEIDGQTMPNDTFKPVVGDTYAIFGVMLPDAYICDNETKEGASWDMFREAAKHLYENEDQKFTFTGTLQSLYAKRNWVNIGGKLIVGSYIHFSDEQFAPDGTDIRIIGIKDFLTSPYSPTVEISNNVSGQSLSSKLREIDSQDVVIEQNKKDVIQFTKRRFRDAQETLEMLNDSLLHFSGSINPITVQTMAALIGDESLQFQFVTSLTSTTIDTSFQVTYDATTKQLSVPHSFLRHMTLGINSIKSSHAVSEYKTWEMTAFVSARLEDGDKKYYLYAKVDTDAASKGEFLLSETAIDLEAVSGYYHLLVGVLNSEFDDERSYVSLYGFTEVLPGRITTDRIVSSSGDSYFDMLANAMKLGDALDFNSQGDGKLRLRGTLVQSEAGTESYIGCYRGVYNSSYTYYNGDEVSYTYNGVTSTYRYINSTPSKGNLPTDTNYWIAIALGQKGEQGQKGDYVLLYYTWAVDAPTKPSGTSLTLSGWHTSSEREDPTMTYDGTFTARDGYRYSPTIGHSESTMEKVSFTTTKANQIIAIDLHVSSEASYDKAYVGYLDYSTINDSNCAAVISGSTSKTVCLFVKTAGSHFFYIKYAKDGNQSSGTDNCWYRVIKTENLKCWVCQAQVNGATDAVRTWSDVTQFIYDNANDESIYLLSATNSTPSTPSSEALIDDYVPPVVSNYYNSSTDYSVGETVMADATGLAYECIQACTGIAVTNTSYWKNIPTWTDDPSNVSSSYPYQYVAIRRKENGKWGAFSTPSIFSVFIKGDTGDYFERRYAVNGSTSAHPSISTTSRTPSGWSTTIPSVRSMQYLWMTEAKISGSDDSLLTSWSTPVRQTPYDGKDGISPALVFRGVFSATKSYYGNANRVDAVKYGSVYYRARVDAASSPFTGITPGVTDGWEDYWNSFGASFESVATDLLLTENASIGDWYHSGGKIVSTISGGNKIELNASMPQILIESSTSGGDYSQDTSLGSQIAISGASGIVRAQAKRNSSKCAYISPSGIFANCAETHAVSAITGYTRKGAIVGLGYGALAKSSWSLGADDNMLAGVYGIASNSTYNGAPAYGGYFYDLKACGFILLTKYISDDTAELSHIDRNVSQIIGLTNKGVTRKVYLPTDAYEGKIIFLHQMGQGAMKVMPYAQVMYDDDTENTYYDIGCGQTVMAIFGKWNINSVTKEVWCIRKFKF